MRDEVSLTIGEISYQGWTRVNLIRAVDQAASNFRLELTEIDPTNGTTISVKPGQEVNIKFGKALMLSGYIDTVSIDYDGNSHSIGVEGRSKVKDLIDCSALNFKQFRGLTMDKIAEQLALDYGVKVVSTKKGLKPIPSFQVKPDGETVFEAIQRLAEVEGVYLSDTPDGYLLLSDESQVETDNTIYLSGGDNSGVASGSGRFTEVDRYSQIIVKGQRQGTDEDYGLSVSQVSGVANDPEYKRKRVRIMRGDSQMTTDKAERKAKWELQGGAGKAIELTYVVSGWFGNADQLWRENTIVKVTDRLLDIVKRNFLISRVEYNLDADGRSCILTLNPPDAFVKELKDEHDKPEKKKEKRHEKGRNRSR